ncbi:MAG: AgmX/PglI C-terminal domain-containing protein [Polyangiaceae bacterium]|nr:AgmX/PglI C-terminal domain-containing protein [Polyangiaceae bacterium]
MQVTVRLGTASPSNGFLSSDQINRVVRRNQSAIGYCYETQLQRQPSLRGQVTIAWTITLSGAVSGARVGSSSLRNTSVEGCVVRVVGRMRFPEPDGGAVQVSYPFTFGS